MPFFLLTVAENRDKHARAISLHKMEIFHLVFIAYQDIIVQVLVAIYAYKLISNRDYVSSHRIPKRPFFLLFCTLFACFVRSLIVLIVSHSYYPEELKMHDTTYLEFSSYAPDILMIGAVFLRCSHSARITSFNATLESYQARFQDSVNLLLAIGFIFLPGMAFWLAWYIAQDYDLFCLVVMSVGFFAAAICNTTHSNFLCTSNFEQEFFRDPAKDGDLNLLLLAKTACLLAQSLVCFNFGRQSEVCVALTMASLVLLWTLEFLIVERVISLPIPIKASPAPLQNSSGTFVEESRQYLSIEQNLMRRNSSLTIETNQHMIDEVLHSQKVLNPSPPPRPTQLKSPQKIDKFRIQISSMRSLDLDVFGNSLQEQDEEE